MTKTARYLPITDYTIFPIESEVKILHAHCKIQPDLLLIIQLISDREKIAQTH